MIVESRSIKLPPKGCGSAGKTNPSKRHRERLNGELDNVAGLLPFDQSIITKLDKLSILRLSVSYLRIKSYFQSILQQYGSSDPRMQDVIVGREAIPQALNGFLFVVTCDGEVFFASNSVEDYLGFHQSDIIHQSVLELIHSQDRDDFTNQLNWKSQLTDSNAKSFHDLYAENHPALKRSFTTRFRCLLDNTSGFITLEISGRIGPLYGQDIPGTLTDKPKLALFAVCLPFGPLPLLDSPSQGYTFRSKHKMDLAPIAFDQPGKMLFGFTDEELDSFGGYDMVHPSDLTYLASAHQELLKTGSAGMVAYRLRTKAWKWEWLQTGARVIYKNSKPDYIICTHRQLTEEEGSSLVTKRSVEFKLPYPLLETDLLSDIALTPEDRKPYRANRRKASQKSDYGKRRRTERMMEDLPYSFYQTLPAYQTYPSAELLYPYDLNALPRSDYEYCGGLDEKYGFYGDYYWDARKLGRSPASSYDTQKTGYATVYGGLAGVEEFLPNKLCQLPSSDLDVSKSSDYLKSGQLFPAPDPQSAYTSVIRSVGSAPHNEYRARCGETFSSSPNTESSYVPVTTSTRSDDHQPIQASVVKTTPWLPSNQWMASGNFSQPTEMTAYC